VYDLNLSVHLQNAHDAHSAARSALPDDDASTAAQCSPTPVRRCTACSDERTCLSTRADIVVVAIFQGFFLVTYAFWNPRTPMYLAPLLLTMSYLWILEPVRDENPVKNIHRAKYQASAVNTDVINEHNRTFLPSSTNPSECY
jgi:hypothetical protein